jgi:uncharacterized protein
MKTYEVDYAGRLPIDGYAPGAFRVADVIHRGPLALVPEGIVPWAGPPDFGPLLERAASFDVLLVGTGATLASAAALPQEMRGRIEAAGAGVEVMTTPSACRTYNVLLGEGRRVAAALIPV